MLIAFEGIDGSGKSTQAAMLVKWLEGQGHKVVFSKEPTNGPHGQRLRQSFVTKRLSPAEELQAFIDDRREHVQQLVRPALQRGDVVVIDRYYYSTVAYQGARGFDRDEVLKLNESFAPRPEAVFLVDLEPQIALERISARAGGRDLLENLEEQLRVRDAFLALAKSEGNFIVIDGRQSVEQMHARIVAEAKRLLG